MAINQNHLFEELDGIKCAVVEKNASVSRVDFLRRILEYNRYTVVVVSSPPAKAVPLKATAPVDETVTAPFPVVNETFTIGVTDVMFNSINAIFGRLLKLPNGNTVTLAYWHQQEDASHDEIPYFNTRQL